jgi:hypothetical protein
MNFPFGKSSLRRAIERGLEKGKLRDELKELGDIAIKSRTDAEDICWGLSQLNAGSNKFGEQTYALAVLFQEIKDRKAPAFEVLQERGIPELLRLYDEITSKPGKNDTDTLFFILKIFGLYGTVAGTLKIIEAARQPLKPDGYMWTVVLHNFTAGHPERDLLYRSLSEPLPDGFLAVSLLDAANAVLIGGGPMAHPFDSANGKRRLRDWLSDTRPDKFSYAHSATAALPFIDNPERDSLLTLAMNHPDTGVRIEAAWVAAKIGRSDGIKQLADFCKDFKTAETAKRYLTELGHESAIPSMANDPGFAALAEFAQWLAHPSELGRMPDELVIADHRELRWPPERQPKPFWLMKYTIRDITGLEDDDVECGLVGSITFCLFSKDIAQRPPEDGYAIHCYWEMEHEHLIEESNVEYEKDDYDSLINQWTGPRLENLKMKFIAELSPKLGYPQRLVGLASASLNGEPGWVALDGPRSEWYPESEQPKECGVSTVLSVHVGRHLLGFTGQPDRKSFLAAEKPPKPPEPPKSPEQIIAAYEKLLAEARNADEETREESLDSFSPIGKHFEEYVDALQRSGVPNNIRELIDLLTPYWDHNLGYSQLGMAAFKLGQKDLAEQFLMKYRKGCENYARGEDMDFLAELWIQEGKPDAAKDLLLECLHGILEDSKSAEGSDKALFEKWFQSKRAAFLKLFPNDEALLASHAIPQTTLR